MLAQVSNLSEERRNSELHALRLHREPVRCPFCIQNGEFKAMMDLSAGTGDAYYCTSCRHLIRADASAFQCMCANCRGLQRSTA